MGRSGLGQRPRSGRRRRPSLIKESPHSFSIVAVPRGRGISASGASTSRHPQAPNPEPPTPNPQTPNSNSQTPNQAVGTRFLKGSEASPDDVGTILRGLGVAKFRMFETCSDAGLDAPARLALMRHADSQQPAAEADFKLGLSRVELVSLVGEKAALSLELTFRRFGGDAYRSASLPPFFSTPPTTRSELFTPFRE